MKRLQGRVALITGACGGMGLATVQLFLENGASVIATDLPDRASAAWIESLGEHGTFIPHDVTREQDWEQVMAHVQRQFGRIDVLVNNAGILRFATILEMDPDIFEQVMRVNTFSVFLGTRAVVPAMLRRRTGSIINVSSTGALCPTNATSAYAASKAAVQAFTRAAALEFGPHGIRVNSIHPGGINTPMTNPEGQADAEVNQLYRNIPLQRAGAAMEVARASLFLASDDASYFTGSSLVVDGGSIAGHYHDFLPGAPGSLSGA